MAWRSHDFNKRINNILIPLRAILGDAFADGLIDRNPVDRIENLAHQFEEPNPFTPDERDRILKACESQPANLFVFAFWTGLRTSELIALEWSDIDFSEGRRACASCVGPQENETAKDRSGQA